MGETIAIVMMVNFFLILLLGSAWTVDHVFQTEGPREEYKGPELEVPENQNDYNAAIEKALAIKKLRERNIRRQQMEHWKNIFTRENLRPRVWSGFEKRSESENSDYAETEDPARFDRMEDYPEGMFKQD